MAVVSTGSFLPHGTSVAVFERCSLFVLMCVSTEQFGLKPVEGYSTQCTSHIPCREDKKLRATSFLHCID